MRIYSITPIGLFPARHKVVHDGEPPTFFNGNTNNMTQMLQILIYKECSLILTKFTTFRLLILILGTSAIMDQKACC